MNAVRIPMVILMAAGLSVGMTTLLPGNAAAQSTQQSPAAAPSLSNGQLEAFAKATVDVQKVSDTYQPKLSGAEDPNVQKQLRQRQSNEMIDAVNEAGLTVEQYNAIHTVYRSDPKTAAKINQLISQLQ